MTISDHQRRDLVLMYEGYALKSAGDNGQRVACEFARCNLDGTMNALVRMEGAQAAAEYAFALADRVVGRLRTPTQWPPAPSAAEIAALTALASAIAEPPPVEKPAKAQPRAKVWAVFLMGLLCGLAIAVGMHR